MPAAASISASAIVAHLTRVMPSCANIRAISDNLCVFMCGRSRDAPPAIAASRRRFSAARSGYTSSAGDGTSSTLATAYHAFVIENSRKSAHRQPPAL